MTLWLVRLDGSRTEIAWDRPSFEYLTAVSWTGHGPPVLQVLSRDQKRAQVLAVDVTDGSTQVIRELSDEAWIDVMSAPRWAERSTGGGRLVTLEDRKRRRVCVDGRPSRAAPACTAPGSAAARR